MNETNAWDIKYGTEASEIARRKDELRDGFVSGTLQEVFRFEKENAEVLEIGCGTGQHSVALGQARPSWRITATDTSQNAVDETAALARSAGTPAIRAMVADATALPFTDSSFDVVFGDHVLGHIPDAGLAVSECLRVLKSGGIAVFNGGNALRPDGWPLHHALSKKTYYKRSFLPHRLIELFAAHGAVFVRSYGTLVFLDRGWKLLLSRKPKTDSSVRLTSVPGTRRGTKQKVKALLDRTLPAWLKVEYGIVVTKV